MAPSRDASSKSAAPIAGANFAGSIVDDHDRRGQFGAEPRDAFLGERFKLRLQPRVDREADDLRLSVGGDRLFRGVGGEFGEGFARLGDRLALGGAHVVGGDDPARRDPLEHAVPGRARSLAETVGPARFRRLRQRDEERRFGDRELQRLLAEIGERRRPHALEIAAKRRQREIAVEHARFADLALDLQRAGDLPQLRRKRAFRTRLDETRDLHAERRSAGNDAAAP